MLIGKEHAQRHALLFLGMFCCCNVYVSQHINGNPRLD